MFVISITFCGNVGVNEPVFVSVFVAVTSVFEDVSPWNLTVNGCVELTWLAKLLSTVRVAGVVSVEDTTPLLLNARGIKS